MRPKEATQVTGAIRRRRPPADQNQPGGSLMFQHILIPVSDCPCSERAAETAIQLSRLLGCRLVFLHVLTDDQAKLEEGRELAQHLLERMARSTRFLPVLRLSIVDGQSIAERILEVARDEQVDLIVIGTHGRQGAERLVLGSVTRAVAGSSEIPVQVIPVRVRKANRFADRWRRALGGIGSPES
jgi:nucleotide-binding universal stress UspA family protein